MEAIWETLEIVSDKDMMKAIRDFETSKVKLKRFDPTRG